MRLSLENVTKMVREQPYLYDIDLDLASGSFNVLLGPTQAGKTSLLRLMAGLDFPSSGTIREDGADVTLLGVRKRNVAMVYQEFVNYPSFTVFENIAAPLRRAKRLSASQIDAKVRARARMMHIDHLLHRLPSELSGGQQQRVALARALVKEAPLLLLDEPLVNLDYKLREELRSELREIFRHGTTTVVYATTEPQEALLFGGNTLLLDAGRVLQSGPALVSPPRDDPGEPGIQRSADQPHQRGHRSSRVPPIAQRGLPACAAHARTASGELLRGRAGWPHRLGGSRRVRLLDPGEGRTCRD
jgi:glycerol transport system ATP-binding protein